MTWDEAAKNDKFFYLKMILRIIVNIPKYLFIKRMERFLEKNDNTLYYCDGYQNKAIVLISNSKLGIKDVTITIPPRSE